MRLKQILLNMNSCENSLEDYCEILDKESLGQLTFSMLKTSLEKYYSSISKSNKVIKIR